jgi:hypothetical protein
MVFFGTFLESCERISGRMVPNFLDGGAASQRREQRGESEVFPKHAGKLETGWEHSSGIQIGRAVKRDVNGLKNDTFGGCETPVVGYFIG